MKYIDRSWTDNKTESTQTLKHVNKNSKNTLNRESEVSKNFSLNSIRKSNNPFFTNKIL